MILCLSSPLHPLSKLLAIQDHTQNLEEQLWMGGRREVSIIFNRPVTRSGLKQERSFFRGSVSSLLRLVVVLFLCLAWFSGLTFININHCVFKHVTWCSLYSNLAVRCIFIFLIFLPFFWDGAEQISQHFSQQDRFFQKKAAHHACDNIIEE